MFYLEPNFRTTLFPSLMHGFEPHVRYGHLGGLCHSFDASLFEKFKVDVKETEMEYFVEAELPGVNKDDITLKLQDDILTISVSSEKTVEDKKENYLYNERGSFSCSRSFELFNSDSNSVKAKFENGILEIKVPKREKEVGTKIMIE